MGVGTLGGASLVAGVLAVSLGLGGCGNGTGGDAAQNSVAESAVEESVAEQETVAYDVTENTEFGNVEIHVTEEQLHELGIDVGDSLDLVFSSGYEMHGVPYYNGFYTKTGEQLVIAYPGIDCLWAAINRSDSLWDVAGLSAGDTVTIALNEKGAYAEIQNACNLKYTDNRDDYENDEAFANYRQVDVNAIAPNVLYRSASMCNMLHNRATYVDEFAQKSGIACAIDLGDDAQMVEKHMADERFASNYFTTLFKDGKVVLAGLKIDYTADEFHAKLVDALAQSMERPTPWLVFCTEGTDRTGFVSMLLEALAGASYQEIEADYMVSYANYYGITREGDPDRYNVIVSELFHPMVAALFDETEVDVESVDLAQGAKSYLAKGGMKEGQIEELKGILTGTVTAGEKAAE